MAQSQDDQLEKLKKYYTLRPGVYINGEIEALYEHVKKQPNGPALLQVVTDEVENTDGEHLEPAASITTFSTNVSGFKYTATANSSSVNVIFYTRIMVTIKDLPGKGTRYATTNAGGLCFGLPGGVNWGTFYYDDVNDLQGEGITTQCGGLAGYWEVTYWRDNHCFATYQAGGIPGGACVMGGSTDFS